MRCRDYPSTATSCVYANGERFGQHCEGMRGIAALGITREHWTYAEGVRQIAQGKRSAALGNG